MGVLPSITLGRATPYIGTLITIHDYLIYIAIPMGQGVSDYTNEFKDSGLIYLLD